MTFEKDNLMQEIERKWLVEPGSLPERLSSYPNKELVAGYFKGEDGKDVRIRKEGSMYFKVKKSGRGLVRDVGPGDIKITQNEFLLLWPKTEGRRLRKKRHYIEREDFVLELDIYHDFKDFYTVEVEFKTVKDAEKFVPPEWFGREVTGDNGYTSNSLATRGLPKGWLNGRR